METMEMGITITACTLQASIIIITIIIR